MIFVVDLSNAALLDDEPKVLTEMTEDIVDAIGVAIRPRRRVVAVAIGVKIVGLDRIGDRVSIRV